MNHRPTQTTCANAWSDLKMRVETLCGVAIRMADVVPLELKVTRALAKRVCVVCGLIMAFCIHLHAADPTVSVTAQQRYPWNGMVDVAFTIAGESGAKYDTSLVARDVAGGTNLTMKTIYKSDGSAAALTNQLAAGSYKWVWNAATDLPSGFNCERVKVDVNASAHQALYMVIDLSSGSGATSYPVSYLDAVPSGGWTDTYKTTKLVLRKLDAGTFMKGGTVSTSVSKGFYVGVFEVTQGQYKNVCGSVPETTGILTRSDKFPVADVSYGSTYSTDRIRVRGVDAFLNKLCSCTSLSFTVPTEIQWEYACRAGTTSLYNNGGSSESDLRKLGCYYYFFHEIGGNARAVGSFTPNKWGLYDMHGNVCEICSDFYDSRERACRGGGWYSDADGCTSSSRVAFYGDDTYGFRVIVNRD